MKDSQKSTPANSHPKTEATKITVRHHDIQRANRTAPAVKRAASVSRAAQAPATTTYKPAPQAAAQPVTNASRNQNPMAINAAIAAQQRAGAKKIVTVALIVMAALCTLTIIGYIKMQEDTSSNLSTANSKAIPAITQGVLDDESAALDNLLQPLDDAKDLPNNDLTDNSLGL